MNVQLDKTQAPIKKISFIDNPAFNLPNRLTLMWITVIVTLISGIIYVFFARKTLLAV